MAKFAVRLFGNQTHGWHGDLTRDEAFALPRFVTELLRRAASLEGGMIAPLKPDRFGRATIAHTFRDGPSGWSLPRADLEQVINWWLIWMHGDTEVRDAAGIEDLVFEVRPGSQPLYHAVSVSIGGAPLRLLPDRPFVDEAPAREPVALLAAQTLRALATPQRYQVFPGDIVAELLRIRFLERWDEPTRRARIGPSFARMQTVLRQAQKMVFDKQFSQLVLATSEENPERLLQLLKTARAPFENLWIEWDRSGSTMDRHGINQWGALLQPHPGHEGQYRATIVMGPAHADSVPGILPGSLILNFHGPVTGPLITLELTLPEDEQYILQMGPIYSGHWPERFTPIMHEFAQHAQYAAESLPYGDLIYSLITEYNPATVTDVINQYIASIAQLGASVCRELISGLALVATHIDDEPLVSAVPARIARTLYRGKPMPAIDYKVLQITRPMPLHDLWHRMFPGAKGPVREHRVIGAWHHQRAPNAHCRKHPRACPIVSWKPIEPRDEDSESDIQACVLCKRRRWWVRDHLRGDRDIGLLTKDYEVTSA